MILISIVFYIGIVMLWTETFSVGWTIIAFLLFILVAIIDQHERKNEAKERVG